MQCPSCKEKISWSMIGRYTNWYFKRLIDDCPHCHLKLILIKLPLRTLNLAMILILSSGVSFLLFGSSMLSGALALLSLSCILYVATANKLKVARVSR
jgi:hypothetical protein